MSEWQPTEENLQQREHAPHIDLSDAYTAQTGNQSHVVQHRYHQTEYPAHNHMLDINVQQGAQHSLRSRSAVRKEVRKYISTLTLQDRETYKDRDLIGPNVSIQLFHETVTEPHDLQKRKKPVLLIASCC
jgi:hypothetical protein